jgi:pimeloyl-ACP methyl ester carboxylesterase
MITRNQIEINGKRISYLKSGDGQNLILFLHGNGMAAENWRPQLENQELTDSYTLTAVDLPGHGKSDWSNEMKSMYDVKNIARLLDLLLENLKAKDFLLVGLSLGTNVIGEVTTPLPGCRGIMLVSPCIVNDQNLPGNIITTGPNGHVIATPNVADEDLRSFVYYHMKNTRLAEQYIADYKNTDPAFREQLGETMMNASWTDELANIQARNVPVCVVFGKDDSLLKIDYLNDFSPLWNNKVHYIENAGHFVNEERPAQFNVLLSKYANERFK